MMPRHPRERVPTLSEIDELVTTKVELEREQRNITFDWLDARIRALEGKVTLWGAIPTIAVLLAALIAYLERRP
jgi:hypothetical protein